MKRTWKDNPKKNPEVRRKRPPVDQKTGLRISPMPAHNSGERASRAYMKQDAKLARRMRNHNDRPKKYRFEKVADSYYAMLRRM